MQTNCNEVVVLPQGEHGSVNISRPAGKEVTDTRKMGMTEIFYENEQKERGSESTVQKITFNYFPRPRLIT